jgi:hypothetical protein
MRSPLRERRALYDGVDILVPAAQVLAGQLFTGDGPRSTRASMPPMRWAGLWGAVGATGGADG